MTRTPTALHTRPDGSIDTAYYIAKGRVCRSRQFHSMTHASPPKTEPTSGWFRGWFG